MNDDLATWAHADALGADAGYGLEREVNDAAFARVHGIEFERLARGLHAFGGGARHHFQFFDAKRAVPRDIEKNLVLKWRLETKGAMGEMFDGLEKFGATFEQEIFVAAGQVGENFRATFFGICICG